MLTYADVICRDLGHGRSTLIPKDYFRVFKAKNIGESFFFYLLALLVNKAQIPTLTPSVSICALFTSKASKLKKQKS